jgi:hypothetical protein
MRRKALASLSAAALVYLCGAAEPMSSHTHVVKLMDFDTASQVVAGYPDGEPPLGLYQRTNATQHLAGVVGPLYPPNPCRGLIIAWNRLLVRTTLTASTESTELQTDIDRPALGRILMRMALHQCNAEIVSDTSQSPEPIVSIRPVP